MTTEIITKVKRDSKVVKMEGSKVLVQPDDNGEPDYLDDPDVMDDPIFTPDQIETLAQVMADMKNEFRAEFAMALQDCQDAIAQLRNQVSEMRGQVSVLVSLVGDNNKTIDVSEVIRKIKVQP